MKRILDIVVSGAGLLVFSPLLAAVLAAIWLQDFHNPLYIAPRVGRGEKPFRMVKLRSMRVQNSGSQSTSAGDKRITRVGHFVRRYKLDEIAQLWNVLTGDMSLVGPRPNVKSETDLYTPLEKGLLAVKPGITDFSSIVFADEGEILKDAVDVDRAYRELIRPWKSQLGLFYIERGSFVVDLALIFGTALAILSRGRALKFTSALLERLGAPQDLVKIALRDEPLVPTEPPGEISPGGQTGTGATAG